MAIGHLYYFFEDVYPNMPGSNGKKILACPMFIKNLFGENQENEVLPNGFEVGEFVLQDVKNEVEEKEEDEDIKETQKLFEDVKNGIDNENDQMNQTDQTNQIKTDLDQKEEGDSVIRKRVLPTK